METVKAMNKKLIHLSIHVLLLVLETVPKENIKDKRDRIFDSRSLRRGREQRRLNWSNLGATIQVKR
jgi:hypothetical protein